MMASYTATASGGRVTDCPVNRFATTSDSVPRMTGKGRGRLLMLYSLGRLYTREVDTPTLHASKNFWVSNRGLSLTQADTTATEACNRQWGSIMVQIEAAMVSKSFLVILISRSPNKQVKGYNHYGSHQDHRVSVRIQAVHGYSLVMVVRRCATSAII